MTNGDAAPNMQAVHVCLLPRQAFTTKDQLLQCILHDDTILNVAQLLDAPAAVLCSLLTLVVAAIEQVGVGSDRFISLARALRDRASSHRTLKLRLLVALNHPSFPAWRLRKVVRESPYHPARSRLRVLLQEVSSKEIDDGKNADGFRPISRAFCEALAERIFHPSAVADWARSQATQLEKEDEVFDYSCHGSGQSFSYDKLLMAVRADEKVVDDVHAAAVVQKLISLDLAHVSNTSNNSIDTKRMRSHLWTAIHDAAHLSVHNEQNNAHTTDKIGATVVGFVMPVDLVDLQTLDFWTETVFDKHAAPGFHFGYRLMGHPLRISSIERYGNDKQLDMQRFSALTEEDARVAHDALVVHSVTVEKVFSSLSRPYMVQLRRALDGATVDESDLHIPVWPNVLVKKGDNMMQDHCVSVMFQVFNFIWRQSTYYQGALAVPHCLAYEVMPTGLQRGVMEGISGLVALGEVDWNAWYARHARDESGATIINMVHSAAGAYVGGYVLGAMDRHWSNMVIKDDCTLLHIDFSFILGDGPPIDAPRVSIPPSMERLFRGVKSSTSGHHNGGSENESSLWDAFVEATVRAYLALRHDAKIVLRAAHLLFPRAGFEGHRVHGFLRSKSGLALDKNDKDAAEYLRRKIVKSSSHWKTQLKRFVHDIVNPAWYHIVQNGPLPADGVMKLINRYQSESASTQRLSAQSAAKFSQSKIQIDIDE